MQVSSGVDDPCKDLNINICDSAWTANVFEILLRILVLNLLRVVHDTLVVRYIRDVKTKQGELFDVGGPRPMQWWMPDAENILSRECNHHPLFLGRVRPDLVIV